MSELREILERLLERRDLSEAEAGGLLVALTDATVAPAMSGALLAALRSKGITPDEVRGFAGAMRELARRPELPPAAGHRHRRHRRRCVGQLQSVDGRGTARGRHGRARRQARQSLGFEPLRQRGPARGARAPLAARRARRGECLAATGFTFLFAPHYHPAMKEVAPVRRALGVRTVFNLLGPLTNPAEPPFSLIGAYSAAAAKLMADTLAGMPIERVFVIHGEPGWDEATPVGPFELYDVRPGRVVREVRDPREFGIGRCSAADLAGGDAEHNAVGLRAVFEGRDRGPHRDAVVLNAALALEVAGAVPSAAAGVQAAHAAIDRGDAQRLLERIAAFGRARSVRHGPLITVRTHGPEMGLLSDMLDTSLRRVAEARERVPEAALRAAMLGSTATAAVAARSTRLRRHRGTEAALAVARRPFGRDRGSGAPTRGLCRRWRGGLLDPDRADSLRWRPRAPAPRRGDAAALRHSGDAQGFPRRPVPGARGSRPRRVGRAADRAHGAARAAGRDARLRRRARVVRAARGLRCRGPRGRRGHRPGARRPRRAGADGPQLPRPRDARDRFRAVRDTARSHARDWPCVAESGVQAPRMPRESRRSATGSRSSAPR